MHPRPVPHRRPTAWLLLGALLLAAAALAGPSSAASATRLYADRVAPATAVPVATPTPVSVTLTSCAPCSGRTSTLPFGSAEVTLPAGASWALRSAGAGAGPDVTHSVASRSAAWSAVPRTLSDGRTVVGLRNSGSGTTAAVRPGESVTLHLVLTAPAPGTLGLSTAVKQSNDFSGAGNDFTRPAGTPALVLQVAGRTPAALRIVTQPSTVQVSSASPGAGARTVMCPAPAVAVVDAGGATVTGLPPTAVQLLPSSGDGGLRLGGATPVVARTVDGVATFGTADCSSGITATQPGTGLRVVATATYDGAALTSTPSAPFEVLPYFATCAAECTTPVLVGDDGTSAQVVATGGSGPDDLLSFAVGLADAADKQTYASCQPDPSGVNPFRDVVRVDLADHRKAVTLRWSKQAVQWATNNGTPQWTVCLAAAYPFTAAGPLLPAADGLFVGRLLPCADVDPATTPCVSRLSRSAGEQVGLVLLPDVPGDPKMW